MSMTRSILCAAVAALMISACGTQRPVVYPRSNNAATDRARANNAIDSCIAMAKDSGIYGSGGGDVGRRSAENAAVGGAAGAAAGAVYGNAGKGAAAGAAGGAAGGLVRGLFRGSNRGPDAATRKYIERCLTERGYQTAGWR